jgi:hypothetical protein
MLFALVAVVGDILEEQGWLMSKNWLDDFIAAKAAEQTSAATETDAFKAQVEELVQADAGVTPLSQGGNLSAQDQQEAAESYAEAARREAAELVTNREAAQAAIDRVRHSTRLAHCTVQYTDTGDNGSIYRNNLTKIGNVVLAQSFGRTLPIGCITVVEPNGDNTYLIPVDAIAHIEGTYRTSVGDVGRLFRTASDTYRMVKIDLMKYVPGVYSKDVINVHRITLPPLKDEEI